MTGCDLVYGLSGRIGPDASDVDDLDAPLAIDAPEPCTMFSDSVVVSSDTMLLHETTAGNCDPSIRNGRYNNINLGQPGFGTTRSRILLQFTLTSEMLAALQPDGGFTEATLTLSLKPISCPGACPSTAIGLSIHAANNDWNEGETNTNTGAGWCMRKQGSMLTTTMWQVRGGDGEMDRSMMALANVSLTQPEVDGDQLVITTTPTPAIIQDARSWVVGNQLSLLLIPTAPTGTLYVKAREHSGGGGARLTIKSCR